MRLAAILAILASPALAECPAPSVQDGVLRDALRYNGFALDAWGLNAAGNMEELWRLPSGEWIVTETTPARCSAVVSRPAEFMGRLVAPSNDGDAFGQLPLTRGEGA